MSAADPRKGISVVVATAIVSLAIGCSSNQDLPPAPGPYEERTVTVHLSDCDVQMPPVVDWKDKRGREVFDAAGNARVCQMLQILRDGMALRLATPGPVKIGTTLDRPVNFDRITRVYLQRVPDPPDLPEKQRRLGLCAVVDDEKSQFCVSIKGDGSRLLRSGCSVTIYAATPAKRGLHPFAIPLDDSHPCQALGGV
jgi:hypothetical protein